MNLLDAVALLLVLASLFGLANYHILKLPFAIGLLLSGLLASFGVVVVDRLVPGWHLQEEVRDMVVGLNFADTVLSGMLCMLLFAGALHTDLGRLRERRAAIVSLASVGVVISTVVTGFASWYVFKLCGVQLDLVWCLAFGALISPTDPIAVLGIMKQANAPKGLETKVIGESLFNDGTGVVLFTLLSGVGLAVGAGREVEEVASVGTVAALLAKEILGGVGLGVVAGWLSYRAFKGVEEANLEILITVATVFAIGFCATRLHVSAPLAAVAAGLFIGARGRTGLSEEATVAHDTVWTFLDETLNAILFLLIGIVVFAIDLRWAYLYAAMAVVPAVLLARFAGVAIPVGFLRLRQEIDRGTVGVLTWGGLKGGVSVALAMKLPEFDGRDLLLTTTYVVVVFSILVQGLTVGPLIRRLYGNAAPKTEAA